MAEKLKGRFIERFSLHVFYTAAAGGAWVLLDPRLEIKDGAMSFLIGSSAFAPEIRGAVVTAGILATVAAVVALWFGVKQDNARSTDPTQPKENQ